MRKLAISFVLGILTIPAFASAASKMYLAAPTGTLPVSTPFSVQVMVDSNQPLNAYAVDVHYPPGTLDLISVSDANSLITVWQDRPKLGQGTISFTGGALEPFTGTGGLLLTLNFTAAATGSVPLSFGPSYVYLANGKGTKTNPTLTGATLLVVHDPAAGAVSSTNETPLVATSGRDLPPEISFLGLIPDPFNPDQQLLSFLTSDAGSGVHENDARFRSWFLWSDWRAVQNPTAVPKDVWEVEFRTIDNAGNRAEQAIYNWPAFFIELAEALALICAVGLCVFVIMKKKVKL